LAIFKKYSRNKRQIMRKNVREQEEQGERTQRENEKTEQRI
jgi:hypothetical protein